MKINTHVLQLPQPTIFFNFGALDDNEGFLKVIGLYVVTQGEVYGNLTTDELPAPKSYPILDNGRILTEVEIGQKNELEKPFYIGHPGESVSVLNHGIQSALYFALEQFEEEDGEDFVRQGLAGMEESLKEFGITLDRRLPDSIHVSLHFFNSDQEGIIEAETLPVSDVQFIDDFDPEKDTVDDVAGRIVKFLRSFEDACICPSGPTYTFFVDMEDNKVSEKLQGLVETIYKLLGYDIK